jgi:cytochrome P450
VSPVAALDSGPGGDPAAVTHGGQGADPASVGFDPGDPGFIADPYPTLAAMRALGRVLYYPPRRVHLLTQFADVHSALRERRLGRAFRHRYTAAEFGQPETADRWPRWSESERWSLLNLEPPDHTRIRRLVTAVFTARSIAAMRPTIEELSRATLQPLLDGAHNGSVDVGGEGGEAWDLISTYAQPYSVAVICRLLGVPVSDGPRLLAWSHAIVKMYELRSTEAEQRAAERAADEFIGYVRDLIAVRRERSAGDLITELIEVADAGDRLTEDEIVCTVIVLLNAGHEATVNTLGNGMRALLTHPDQWRAIVGGDVEPVTAVEEMLRWDPPLQMFERWVLEDGVVIAGREFGVGDRIGMLFGSANRDPARFHDPDRFAVARGESTHIGFGGGMHFCIGAPLARLELAVSLSQLRAAAPGLRLAAEPEYQPYFVIRGLRALVVTTG